MSAAAAGKKSDGSKAPLVRVRQMAMIILGIVALCAGPLLLVWKQSYIRGTSVRLETMSDTLTALNKEISQLRLKSEQLSGIDRIETFARVALGLEYPSSDRMVIVSMQGKNSRRSRNGGAAPSGIALAKDRIPKGGAR